MTVHEHTLQGTDRFLYDNHLDGMDTLERKPMMVGRYDLQVRRLSQRHRMAASVAKLQDVQGRTSTYPSDNAQGLRYSVLRVICTKILEIMQLNDNHNTHNLPTGKMQ